MRADNKNEKGMSRGNFSHYTAAGDLAAAMDGLVLTGTKASAQGWTSGVSAKGEKEAGVIVA